MHRAGAIPGANSRVTIGPFEASVVGGEIQPRVSTSTLRMPLAASPSLAHADVTPDHRRDLSVRVEPPLTVRVRDVSKAYRIWRHPSARLKASLMDRACALAPAGPLQERLRRRLSSYFHDFYALTGVSFDVRRGESVALIGRNGSGKSTMLQIIAGILQPTQGEVEVHGRVAALLELGSGFNPEYTGRENVYLNASILGLSKAETDAKFDDIAAFADIGEYIDQPVMTYSSGMFVRLAFAVATSVDADVLIVDEALAVGDVFFRQKCYRRLEQLRERGVTVLLVTHSMGDVEQFCQRAILLEQGRVVMEGRPAQVVKHYYLSERGDRPTGGPLDASTATAVPASTGRGAATDAGIAWRAVPAGGQVSDGSARLTRVALHDVAGRSAASFAQGDVATLHYEFELLRAIERPVAGMVLHNDRNVIVHGKNTLHLQTDVPARVPRGARLQFRHSVTLAVAAADYTVEIGLSTMDEDDYGQRFAMPYVDLESRRTRLCMVPAVLSFTVLPRDQGRLTPQLHHGVADLPGHCDCLAVPPAGEP
jgi:lipopolysaccharide transport system ATP-binding protein